MATDGLPVILRFREHDQASRRTVVVVGGGPVAVRRAGALVEAGADVVVIAPQIDDAMASLRVTLHQRPYKQRDLAGAVLVIIATDDAAVNEQVARDARAAGVLVNRADDAEQSDVLFPARGQRGPVTIAVHTGGISAAAAVMIRDELLLALDPDWPTLLAAVAPYRDAIRQQFADDTAERYHRLRDLASVEAMHVLKHEGLEALKQRCDKLAKSRRAASR